MHAYCIHRRKHEDGVGAKFSTVERNQYYRRWKNNNRRWCQRFQISLPVDWLDWIGNRKFSRNVMVTSYYGYCTVLNLQINRSVSAFAFWHVPWHHTWHTKLQTAEKQYGAAKEKHHLRGSNLPEGYGSHGFVKGYGTTKKSQQANNNNKKKQPSQQPCLCQACTLRMDMRRIVTMSVNS